MLVSVATRTSDGDMSLISHTRIYPLLGPIFIIYYYLVLFECYILGYIIKYNKERLSCSQKIELEKLSAITVNCKFFWKTVTKTN